MSALSRKMLVVLAVLVATPPGVMTAQRPAAGVTLPIGLGIAQVSPVPGGTLRFYSGSMIGQKPGDVPASDTVKFGPGLPSVDIAEAPPWLVPEHLKMDYELFWLRVVTITPDWLEVIGNSRTGDRKWIERTAAEFVAWPEFLLRVNSIEAIDAVATPVRARPLDASPILSSARAALPVLAVQGEWARVATHDLADRMPPEGWIRWRRGETLLVRFNPFS